MKKERKKETISWYFLKKVTGEIVYSLFFLALLVTCYFFILISVKPQSFPFVTKKIESYINSTIPKEDEVSIRKISVDLDNLYKLKVILEDVDLNLVDKTITLPKIIAEFSVFDLISNHKPRKITFEDARIKLDSKLNMVNLLTAGKKQESDDAQYTQQIWDIFVLFRNHSIITKEFAINNVEVSFKDQSNDQKTIVIKSAYIKVHEAKNQLIVDSQNIIDLENKKVDVNIDSTCKFDNVALKCDMNFLNIIPGSFPKLFTGLDFLSKIQTNLNANLNLTIDQNYKISSLIFNANAKKGSFYYDQFFSEPIDFSNLSVTVSAKDSFKDVQLSGLEAILDNNIKFNMSMNIKNFRDPNLEESDMYFRISKAPGDKIAKFWPVFLDPQIRDWVKNHIDQGLVKDAYASLKLKRTNNINKVQWVESQVLFSKLRLKYSDAMPEITNIDGIASFTQKNMKIDIMSGDVLNSSIKSGKVTIDDFHAKNIILNLNGLASGDGSDPLKYVDYKGEMADKVTDYINGYSDSSFDIKIPLKHNITLKEMYIKVLSNIKNIESEYLENGSSVNVSVTKKFNDNRFSAYVDLSGATIDLPMASIHKEKNVPSKLTLDISTQNGEVNLDNINWLINKSKINGDILIDTNKSLVTKARIKNNFNNDYTLNYEADLNQATNELLRKVEINGEYLNLALLLKLPQTGDNTHINSFALKSNIRKVGLANGQYLTNFTANIYCKDVMCKDGFIRADMPNNNSLDINMFQKSKQDNFTTVKAAISDISIIAQGLDISNQMIGGDTNIRAHIAKDNYENRVITGTLHIKNGFSVIKNDIFQEISKEKTFEDLEKALRSSDKINFNRLDMNFKIKNNILEIDDLIASSYLIGFTANGSINLSEPDTDIKGLIIPGYSINKLFGIGDIPIIGSIIMGEKGGGLFAARYSYVKDKTKKDGLFKVNAASALAPGAIRNLFKIFD